jgi:hypothetical protein
MAAETLTSPPSGHPVRFSVEHPESSSRLLNGLWIIKLLLAIPHLLILYALTAVLYVIIIIAFFAILFTKKYPRGLFDFAVNILRWQANVIAYLGMMRDEYPPFSWAPGKYPIRFEVDYPESFGRFAPLYKWLLVIPSVIALYIVWIIAVLLWIVAWLAIIITGKFPGGLLNFINGAIRWQYRVYAYAFYLVTDRYPPFSLSE